MRNKRTKGDKEWGIEKKDIRREIKKKLQAEEREGKTQIEKSREIA